MGLRRVVVSPLGVRTRQQAARFSVWRVIGFAVVLVVGVFAVGSLSGRFGPVGLIAILGGAFGLTMVVLNLIGSENSQRTRTAGLFAVRRVIFP